MKSLFSSTDRRDARHGGQASDSRLVSFTHPGSFAAEQYQGLRLRIERLTKARGSQVLAVTSPAAGEGKTLTAINLAGALARESDSRVLLIDADLRRPAVAARLNVPPAPGLTDVLTSDGRDLQSVAHQVPPFQLWAIASGTAGTGIHRLLRSPRLEPLLQHARQQYDVIISFNDTPVIEPRQLVRLVGEAPIGGAAAVIVLRNGRRVELKIPIEQSTQQLVR